MTGEPPKKRARSDSGSSASKVEAAGLPQFHPHSQLWFEDGNIVFIAGSKGFKVHRSIILRESAVLKDRCNTEGAGIEYNGLRSFILDDTTFDVAAMFRGLYGILKKEDVPQYTFATISAFLRMGKKYESPRLYKEAESVLVAHFPPTFDRYDLVCKVESSQRRMKHSRCQSYDIAKLAHQTNLCDVLPSALYRACQTSSDYIFEHRGILKEVNDVSDDHWVILHLFLGRAKLAEAKRAHTFCFLDGELSPSCTSSRACASGFIKGLHAYRDKLLHEFSGKCDALTSVDGAIDKKFGSHLCARCIMHFKARSNAGRHNVWDNLREYLRLPPPPATQKA